MAPNYVQELSHLCVDHIPTEYIHPLPDHSLWPPTSSSIALDEIVPVLDLSDYITSDSSHTDRDLINSDNKSRFVSSLRRACVDWGVFVLLNHGVSDSLLRRVREAQRGFFAQPLEVKREVENDVPSGSYDGYGSIIGSACAVAASSGGASRDWRDYFYVSFLPAARRQRIAKWPARPSDFRETIEEYGEQVVSLWKTLMNALGESLGTSRLQEAFGELDMGMGLNYYPKCPQPNLTLGLRSHSDPGGITILLQDEHVPGLQVKTTNGKWVTVQPIPNALIVNIGDQLEILTNGLYKSVEHRVFVNNASDRISLGCFMNPGDDVEVAPLQEIVGENNTPKYKAMTFKQYRSFIRQKGLPENKKHQSKSKTEL